MSKENLEQDNDYQQADHKPRIKRRISDDAIRRHEEREEERRARRLRTIKGGLFLGLTPNNFL